MTMGAPATAVSESREFLRQLNARAIEERVPLAGSLELTRRCPLRCVHCYLPRDAALARAELSTDEWRRIIDEIAAAGCLNLLLTGGEPLLREDFPAVYRYARERGLLVTVFTSATRITDAALDALVANPPREVEVTLHGASAGTYEAVTGAPGSYRRCRDGIARLLAAGLRVSLKSVLLRRNHHELAAVQELARELGLDFRFDPAVFPRLDQDAAPLAERVPAAAALALDLADDGRRDQWAEQLGRGGPESDRLYTCGAARTAFHVTAQGWLQPCLVLDEPRHDLRRGGFAQGWHGPLASLGEEAAPADFACRDCAARPVCDACPALHRLECGAADQPSNYLCDLGWQRYHQLQRRDAESGAT